MTINKNVVVHIGLGNFSRAHFARYLHDYNAIAKQEGLVEWEIRAVDRDTQRTRDLIEYFETTNYTYDLMASSESYNKTTKIGSIVDLANMGVDPQRAIDIIAEYSTKIVSLTVTEKGYSCDLATGKIMMNNELAHDLTAEGAKSPKSMLGLVTEALRVRMESGMPPITLMSLDNIPGNGHVFRNAVMEFVKMKGNRELEDWIREKVAFPSTMVDRITPNTVNASDTVICEPFRQWVIETNFCNERPQWEFMSGPKLVLTPNVLPYEHIKVRLLNGTHSALAYSAFLTGHVFVDKAITDTRLQKLTTAIMAETVVTVQEVQGMELDKYMAMLCERFSNSKVSDTITRLCEDGSVKGSSFWKPVIIDHIKAHREFPVMSIAIASWIRFCLGVDAHGNEYIVKDPSMAEELKSLAEVAFYHGDVKPFLLAAFGGEVGANNFLIAQVQTAYSQIALQGGMDAFLSNMLRNDASREQTPDVPPHTGTDPDNKQNPLLCLRSQMSLPLGDSIADISTAIA
ncbi:hypothetical protein SARC_10113 [Sphaeroforma arctica JP610]|uniref:mannitol 2-dehydrogenase n=1 Tax=Sphaeroforma arctica JP610 TaxID=667725 RepID=A0A0L0FKW0_9EUKA|nr:hypothetical protein SARC_10113 [Sphaeroforma arctica JP610]KNC77427.1 hypothetical protein SARC_10113 [Sphaeroforma arctica JP610]|eukprot:XP_014151329.1 hypothetical protein SARC_10113 [Sphaeroforma arctica JP610]